MKRLIPTAVPLLLSTTCLHGAVLYDENGTLNDLPDDFTNPQILTASPGENEIIGQLSGGSIDMDFFNLIIPDGLEIVSLRVLAFSGGINGSFLGMQPGSMIADSPFRYIASGNDPSIILPPMNYLLISEGLASTGQNTIPQLVVGPPLNGTNPIPAGEYAFWLNETGPPSTYHISFGVVPEPEVSGLLLLSILGLLKRRKR